MLSPVTPSRQRLRQTEVAPIGILAGLEGDDLATTYAAIMAEAKSLGVVGFGGECFAAAAAINRVLFGGAGSLVAGLNAPLFEEAGQIIGHAAVLFRGACWDADGHPKGEDEIESWGMLDHQDAECQARFAEGGILCTEERAMDAGFWEFADETEYLAAVEAQPDSIEAIEAVLRNALNAYGGRPANPSL